MSRILSISSIPWTIKPIFGLITDLCPIFGYRRKFYIFFCGLLNIFSWLYMAFYAETLFEATLSLFFVNLAISFSTVIGEAIVVELTNLDQITSEDQNNQHNAKDLISSFFIIKSIGILASSYLKGVFIDIMSIKQIFLISACTPVLILIGGIFFIDTKFNHINEKKTNNLIEIKNDNIIDNTKKNYELQEINHEEIYDNSKNKIEDVYFNNSNKSETKNEDLKLTNKKSNMKMHLKIQSSELKFNQNNFELCKLENDKTEINDHLNKNEMSRCSMIKQLSNFMCSNEILIPMFFMAIIPATPSYDDPLFYFLTNELKFSGNIMGQISLASSVTALIGLVVYKQFLKQVKFKIIVSFGCLLLFFFSFCANMLVNRYNLEIGISDYVLCLFSSSATSMIAELIGMPLLSLACIKTPKNLEGTVYSFFISSLNFGFTISYITGSLLTTYFSITATDYKNLSTLILICNISRLIPIFIFFCLNSKYFEEKKSLGSDEINLVKINNTLEEDIIYKNNRN